MQESVPQDQFSTTQSDDRSESKDRRYPFEFHGSGGEYFKIWIVNILLSIVTLYIYSAWAKVRTKRYFYGNTRLDNSSFEYHAQGSQLVLARMIGLVLFAGVLFAEKLHPLIFFSAYALLMLITPWAIWRSTIFNARVSSYRNVKFGFDGKVSPYYLYLMVVPFTPIIVLGAIAAACYFIVPELVAVQSYLALSMPLAFFGFIIITMPWIRRQLTQYTVDHFRYGTSLFDTKTSTLKFYAVFFKSTLVFLLPLLILSAAIIGGLWLIERVELFPWMEYIAAAVAELGSEDGEGPGAENGILFAVGVVAYILVLVCMYLAFVYYQVRLRSHVFSQTLVDQHVQLESTLRARGLFWLIITNMLLLVFTLGFAYPWTAVRKARYMANHSAVWSAEPLSEFVADQQQKVSAFGEEVGDAFDMDMGIGL